MAQPKVKIACVSNLYCREMLFYSAGDTEIGHIHSFDHITFLSSGKLRVETDLGSTDFAAPQMIFIHKDHRHTLTALENNTVAYCIHALRNGDGIGDIIDPKMIPQGIGVPEIFDLAKPVALG
jgi:hypothetical protein